MAFLLDPAFWTRWLGIVVIDLTLAGDNALVIALAVRTLPPRQQFLGRLWGTGGAVALRLLFIAAATVLLWVPLLHLLGGLLLLWIAVKLVSQGAADEAHVRHGASLAEAVWIILIADVAMSLDNVVAVAAAARGDLLLVTFGISLSIPVGVWGGEMALRDRIVQGWLGARVAATLERPAPLVLGVALTALGWWFDRARRRTDRD